MADANYVPSPVPPCGRLGMSEPEAQEGLRALRLMPEILRITLYVAANGDEYIGKANARVRRTTTGGGRSGGSFSMRFGKRIVDVVPFSCVDSTAVDSTAIVPPWVPTIRSAVYSPSSSGTFCL